MPTPSWTGWPSVPSGPRPRMRNCAPRSTVPCPSVESTRPGCSTSSPVRPTRGWWRAPAPATTASSSAAPCPPPWRPTGWPRPGTRTRACTCSARPPPWSRTSRRPGSRTSCGCRPPPAAASSPAPRWPTWPDWRRGAAPSCATPGGTSRRRACRARRPCASWSGPRRTRPIGAALRLLGLGAATAEAVPVDDAGAMRADALAEALAGTSAPVIVCAQAGNVHTGAFDPLPAIGETVRAHGGWLHVDGAFGLWAPRAPAAGTWWTGSSARTPGPPMPTSGSTCRTTRGWCSWRSRRSTTAPLRSRRHI